MRYGLVMRTDNSINNTSLKDFASGCSLLLSLLVSHNNTDTCMMYSKIAKWQIFYVLIVLTINIVFYIMVLMLSSLNYDTCTV